MTDQPTASTRRRHLLTRALAVGLVAMVVSACGPTWGIRESYRNYVTAPFAEGSITTANGAGWKDGPGTGRGPFTWPVEWATFDAGTETGAVQLSGSVVTQAHPVAGEEGVFALDTTFANPRLEIDGDEGTLFVDLTFRPYAGTAPDPVPALQSALDVPFATVDLSGATWIPNGSGNYGINNAPMVGITAAMELIGWDEFYGDPVELDPLTINFNPVTQAPAVAASATIVVSRTEGLRPGDTVFVRGTGFDPAAHTGTRPPLSGQPSGAYVVFGRFLDTWQPSGGAPSSSRTVIAQRWALPAAQHLALDPGQASASFVRLDPFGRFEATLTVTAGGTAGNYGVYTYPGSGAVNAGQERAVLVELVTP